MRVLIVGNPFPNPGQVFLHAKVIALAHAGATVVNLSAHMGPVKLLKKINKDLQKFPVITHAYNSNWFFLKNMFRATLTFPGGFVKLTGNCFAKHNIKVAIKRLRMNLALVMLSRNADVVHFEWNNQATAFLPAMRLIPKPFIVSIRGRGITSQPLTDPQLHQSLFPVFNLATFVHSISNDLTTYLDRYNVPPEKVKLINPAIDLSKIGEHVYVSNKPVRIITVAHYRWKKNLATAIFVMSDLVNQGFDIQYDLVGEGPDREQLEYLIADLGLQDRVTLYGHQPHEWVLKRLSESDIFFMPSVQEGFCNSVIEAQATGLPCVVTDAEGLSENVEHGVTGYVVPRYSRDEMLKNLVRLIVNPNLREQLGKAGRARAFLKFDIRNQVNEFLAMYVEAQLSREKK